MDLSQWIAQLASRKPARVALRFEGREISYSQLAGQIDAIAAALAVRHVRPGDRVAWLGLNSGRSTGRIERTGPPLSAIREWKTGTSRVPLWPDASR